MHRNVLSRAVFALSFVLSLGLIAAVAAENSKPAVIRIANPGVGVGNRPVVGGSAWSLLHLKGSLESEFAPDSTQVTWTFLRGAGPAVNELYANRLADVSLLGDLPSIIGHAGGLLGGRIHLGPNALEYLEACLAAVSGNPVESIHSVMHAIGTVHAYDIDAIRVEMGSGVPSKKAV